MYIMSTVYMQSIKVHNMHSLFHATSCALPLKHTADTALYLTPTEGHGRGKPLLLLQAIRSNLLLHKTHSALAVHTKGPHATIIT